MFYRDIIEELTAWSIKKDRKPLIIRGARQVGKTTVIKEFGKTFDQFIYLNLELSNDKMAFEQFVNIEILIQRIFLEKNKKISEKNNTLIFIDEIQEFPPALNILRYFYEQESSIPVIAAGSTLEILFNKNLHFPVGRVEYKILRPVSFKEFLGATSNPQALELIKVFPFPDYGYDKLMELFHVYAIIGGMPEIINHYSIQKDFTALAEIFDSLITSYSDDVEKYADSTNQIQLIRHGINTSFKEAGKRITFEGFGNSGYRSRDMGEALRTLEKAFLIQLIYPQTGATLPLLPDLKKKPRLQVLDTGIMNYLVGLQSEIIGTENLNDVYKGKMIEHLVGQELLSQQYLSLSRLNFWVREKNSSSAEIDFLYVFKDKLIPLEVKSGSEGKLKSLHLFMDLVPHTLAVRFYGGKLSISTSETTTGKKYKLLNLPYFLVSQLDIYLEWFQKEVEN